MTKATVITPHHFFAAFSVFTLDSLLALAALDVVNLVLILVALDQAFGRASAGVFALLRDLIT